MFSRSSSNWLRIDCQRVGLLLQISGTLRISRTLHCENKFSKETVTFVLQGTVDAKEVIRFTQVSVSVSFAVVNE